MPETGRVHRLERQTERGGSAVAVVAATERDSAAITFKGTAKAKAGIFLSSSNKESSSLMDSAISAVVIGVLVVATGGREFAAAVTLEVFLAAEAAAAAPSFVVVKGFGLEGFMAAVIFKSFLLVVLVAAEGFGLEGFTAVAVVVEGFSLLEPDRFGAALLIFVRVSPAASTAAISPDAVIAAAATIGGAATGRLAASAARIALSLREEGTEYKSLLSSSSSDEDNDHSLELTEDDKSLAIFSMLLWSSSMLLSCSW